MPGVEKITSIPAFCSAGPNQPVVHPNTRTSARPTTIGEIDTGTSMSTLSRARPGNRYRASKSATPTPKTVLMTTAAPATSAVTR